VSIDWRSDLLAIRGIIVESRGSILVFLCIIDYSQRQKVTPSPQPSDGVTGKLAVLHFPVVDLKAPTLVYFHGNADQLGWTHGDVELLGLHTVAKFAVASFSFFVFFPLLTIISPSITNAHDPPIPFTKMGNHTEWAQGPVSFFARNFIFDT